jgi:hypothetical protein
MNTMFKKTLVAAALAGFGFSAFAADVTTNVVNVSKQGSTVGDLTAGNVVVALEAAYAVGDTVTITFTGGLKTAPLSITSSGANAVTLGRTGQTATTVTYRVTEITGAGAVHGSFTFTGASAFVFKAADVLALGKVNATYGATLGTSSSSLDSPVEYNADADLTSGAVFNVRDQFAAAITAPNRFDGVLDVAADREAFTGPTTVDVLTIGLTNNSGDTSAVAKGSTTFVVSGDFSWAEDATVATPACTAGAVVGTPAITASTYTFACNAATTGATLTLDIDQGADTVAVNPTSFSLVATHGYGASTASLAQAALNAGAWTVNGSVVTVPYMVYGTVGEKVFSQVLNLTNNGSQTGTIYADVWATDAVTGKSVPVLSNVKVGTSNPKSTAKLAGVVRQKMAEATTPFLNGTVAIRLITDVKADSVSVYSAYVDNTTAERAIVNNDSPVVASKVVNP